MAVAARSPFASARRRLIKDRIARYGVTAGGLLVLAALLLIFGYLLYVVVPIFKPVSVSELADVKVSDDQVTLLVGSDELSEVVYRLRANGELSYYATAAKNGRAVGDLLQTEPLPIGNMTALARDSHTNEVFGVANDVGQVLLVEADTTTTFPNDVRMISPLIRYPLGAQPQQIDASGQPLTRLAIAMEDGARIAAYTADNRLLFARFKQKHNLMTDSDEWKASVITLATQFSSVDELQLTPTKRFLFVRSGDQLEVWDVRGNNKPQLRETLRLAGKDSQVTAMALLSGSSSIVVGKSDGTISQWFEVDSKSGGRGFERIRDFEADGAIVALETERDRKGFYALTANGNLAIFHATAHNRLWQDHLNVGAGARLAIKPRANGLVVAQGDQLAVYKVENEHPEISFATLWHEVWYEGYPEPQYVWQSTSGSDSFEPKLSLVPITFGTIKAAFYAMLFGVPIAVAGAIYSAYFMAAPMRRWVKPTVEIMAALPTVILGFLAGLWLAPLIEENLPGIAMVIVALPLGVLLTGMAWQRLPRSFKQRVPEGWEAAIAMVPVLLVGWGAFALSPIVELWLFGGDARVFMTTQMGIGFDQRNALIVGIAMGFAVIPNIFSIAEDAVFSVPRHLTNGSLALGATSWQTLTRVVMLTASPGIFSAVMIGLGRAVGETMIVLMATGNTPVMDWSIFSGMRTLAANIAVEMPESAVGSSHYRVLFLSAFVLFILTFILNTMSELVRERLRKRYSSL